MGLERRQPVAVGSTEIVAAGARKDNEYGRETVPGGWLAVATFDPALRMLGDMRINRDIALQTVALTAGDDQIRGLRRSDLSKRGNVVEHNSKMIEKRCIPASPSRMEIGHRG